jgi:hypothetical protein
MPSQAAQPAPHSWDIEHWPTHVYPHSEGRARWLIRAHKDELILAGAITRVGREFVLFGNEYSKWLQSKKPKVLDFVPNVTAKKRGAAA